MATAEKFDPVTLEIVRNSLDSITEQMGAVIARTAYSTNIKEALDYSTALATESGELISIGAGVPLHCVAMSGGLEAIIRKYKNNILPGDVFITNDPYEGSGHLPDINVALPIFVDSKLAAWAATMCHHADIGGRMPGGNASDSTEIYQEGLRIPPLKLYEQGKPNDAVFSLIRTNVRLVTNVTEDLRAQVSACYIAEKAYLELVKKYGLDEVGRYSEELVNYGERVARDYIASLPDGVYEFEDYIETDGIEEVAQFSVPIRVKVTVKGDSMVVDLTGSSPQVRGAINCPLSAARAAVFWAFREMVEYSIPNNGGYFRPLTVITEPGTIFNPVLPAPVAAAALSVVRLHSSVTGAFSKINPNRTTAAGQDSPNGITIGGWSSDKKPFIFLEFVQVGTGGRPIADGLESCYILSIASAEVIERDYPLVVEELRYVPNTGGAGKHRGSLSTLRRLRFTGDEAVLQVRTDRRKVMAFGLVGGEVGTPSGLYLDLPGGGHLELKQQVSTTIKKGTVITSITAGGGGWGNPLERELELVLEDVVNGKFTVDYVKEKYGVVIDEKTKQLDIPATEKLRSNMTKGGC